MKCLISILCLFVFSCDSGGGDAIIEGCTNEYACNYDETAIVDDDTCYYSEDGCTMCSEYNGDCPDDWNPVCGCDGITYSNGCYASATGIFSTTPGECDNPLDCSNIEGHWVGTTLSIYYEGAQCNEEDVIDDISSYQNFIFYDNGAYFHYDDYENDGEPYDYIEDGTFICNTNNLELCSVDINPIFGESCYSWEILLNQNDNLTLATLISDANCSISIEINLERIEYEIIYTEYVEEHWSFAKWIKDFFNPTGNQEDDIYTLFLSENGDFISPWESNICPIEFTYNNQTYHTFSLEFKDFYEEICNTNEDDDYQCNSTIEEIESIVNNSNLNLDFERYISLTFKPYFAGWNDSSEGYIEGFDLYTPNLLFYNSILPPYVCRSCCWLIIGGEH